MSNFLEQQQPGIDDYINLFLLSVSEKAYEIDADFYQPTAYTIDLLEQTKAADWLLRAPVKLKNDFVLYLNFVYRQVKTLTSYSNMTKVLQATQTLLTLYRC